MEKVINNFYTKILSNLRNKNKIFYKYNKKQIKYTDILKKVEKFYSFLENNNIKRIALYCDKTVNYYATVIAILLSGKTWIQLSKNNPKNRNITIIKESLADLVISDEHIKFHNKIKIKYFDEIINNQKSTKLTRVCKIKPKNLSCIFFTSGSTGKPKGVKITYMSMISSLNHQLKNLKYSKNDTFSDFHESSFVMSLNTILPCIVNGSSITPFLNESDKIIGDQIIKKNNVSVLITVPSYILLLNEIIKKKLKIKKIILCGESFSLNTLSIIKRKFLFQNLYNCYGATELSPWAFSYSYNNKDDQIIKKEGQVPIGKPFRGINVSNNNGKELLVSGDILSNGYIDKRKNKNKFIKKDNKNFYNTGDLFKVIKGKYFILGRNDKQIKLNGIRINLLDIDCNLRKFNKINFAFSYFKNNKIFTIYNSKYKIDEEVLKNFLKKNLPIYMLPKKFNHISKIKFNNNGKIDRELLIRKFS